MPRPLSRWWLRLLSKRKQRHHANGSSSTANGHFASSRDGKSAARRPLLIAFALPTGIILFVLVLAAITSPELTTRRARLARAIAASRPDTDVRQALRAFYRASFTAPPLPSDPPLIKCDIIEPQDTSGLGAGWTFVMIHALAEGKAQSAYQWRDGFIDGAGLTGPRWIIPQAGLREQPTVPPVAGEVPGPTGGALRHAWFGMYNWTDLHKGEDEKGYMESSRRIAKIIRREVVDRGVPMSRVIIGGFSQGSVMSLLLTLTLPEPPAGVFIISGYLPLPHLLLSLAPPSLSLPHTRLAWLHGLNDPYLTARGGELGYKLLKQHVEFQDMRWRSVEGVEHGWNDEGARHIFAWVKGVVNGE